MSLRTIIPPGLYEFSPGGDSLPDQSGQNGKFLTTNGTIASWAAVPGGGDMLASTYDPAGVSAQLAGANGQAIDAGLFRTALGLSVLATTVPGTGVATALAVNVGTAGAFVVNGGALGTPASGTLTNCTGYATGSLTGLGTGVATALAVNVGTAGAFVVNGGALGTPASGTLTSCTGLPVLTGISGLGTGVATWLAVPSSANLAAAVTGETGTGALVFGTNPTLDAPTINGSVATTGLTLPAHTSGLLTMAGNIDMDGYDITDVNILLAGDDYGFIQTHTHANDTWTFQAYDTNAASYTSFMQLKAGDPPSCTFLAPFDVGSAGGNTGSIDFLGTTSGTVTLKVADTAGTWTMTLPTNDGDSGQVLSTNGSGVCSWVAAGGVPTTITVANEATDTSCFIGFFTAATGDLGPKSNTGLTFDSSTRTLGLGVASGATGKLNLLGTTSGVVTLSVADAAGTWTMKLPANDGDASQFLQTDGSGNCTWATPSGGGVVVAVKSVSKTDTFTTTSTSATDVTGMSITHSLSNSSNKIKLIAVLQTGCDSTVNFCNLQLVRDSTALNIGDSAGSRQRVGGSAIGTAQSVMTGITLAADDSPGDTSSHDYKVQMWCSASGNSYLNRSYTDADASTSFRGASYMILIETTS